MKQKIAILLTLAALAITSVSCTKECSCVEERANGVDYYTATTTGKCSDLNKERVVNTGFNGYKSYYTTCTNK